MFRKLIRADPIITFVTVLVAVKVRCSTETIWDLRPVILNPLFHPEIWALHSKTEYMASEISKSVVHFWHLGYVILPPVCFVFRRTVDYHTVHQHRVERN